ncbi:hypothetical protein [Halalkalibacter lacteus]|uniref:hypothetical protein n=1 Tax=Halalkalibacter lacteus TaxID=3090663 RepID=UPI002FC5EF2D
MDFEPYNEWFESLSYEEQLEVMQENFNDAVEGSIEEFERENAVRMLPAHLRQVYEENIRVEIIQLENGYSDSRQTFDIVSENLNIPRKLVIVLLQKTNALIDDMLADYDKKE